jgi:cardiolipin synthase A/B
MDLLELFSQIWQYLVAGLTLLISIGCSGHAVLQKRDPRAAILWVGVIWLVPLIGGVLYLMFGVNRIRRIAMELRGKLDRYAAPTSAEPYSAKAAENWLPREAEHLHSLVELVERVVSHPLLPGNQVAPLINGDQAYPAMLEAIDGAQRSVTLATYIFDSDPAGREFVEALARAVKRGVQVRVLVDDTGARYSWPRIFPLLRQSGVPHGRFLPNFSPWQIMSLNLRNHRKTLVVDGCLGFTGGMNIRQGNLVSRNPSHPVQDLHFQIEGPVVAQLQESFADDWKFCTKEELRGETWFPKLEEKGPVLARGIPDGPDEDFDKLRFTILGALSCAQKRVRIMTPYFLPDQTLITALNVAVMRGVEVDVLLPAKNNLRFVHWAACAQLWQVLSRGCRVWFTPPPFDHSKLMLVDGHWALIGSANWDPRSLRLNFEFNVECYGRDLGAMLENFVQGKLENARQVTAEEMDSRSLPVRLRDGTARLLMPFL